MDLNPDHLANFLLMADISKLRIADPEPEASLAAEGSVGFAVLPVEDVLPDGDPVWVVDQHTRDTRTFGGPLALSDVVESLRHCCCLAAWKRRLPISGWIARYGWKDLQGDLIAGRHRHDC